MNRFLLVLSALVLSGGCGVPDQEPPKLPPWLVPKSIFRDDRVWYVGSTVIDAPLTTATVSYVGQQEVIKKVRWRIEQGMLIGYRAFNLTWGDTSESRNITAHTDPLVAFRIVSHVDEYNGQVVSSAAKSWSDKEYMIVDWSMDLVPNMLMQNAPPYSPVAYAITDPDHPDAPVVTDDYIEVIARYGYHDTNGPSPWEGGVAVCGSGEYIMCEPSEITVRRSMFPVPEDSQYEPMEITNVDLVRTGLFRKGFLYVDSRYGSTETGRRYFMDKHQIWKRTRDESGATLPFSQREIQPVTWYVDDEFPADLMEAARQAIADWNVPFRDAVNGRRYWECLGEGRPAAECEGRKDPNLQVLKFCPHNPVQEGDDPDCGPPGRHVKVGDMRYNLISWVTSSTVSNPAGVGWFNVDHETGQLLSGHIFVNAVSALPVSYQQAVAIQLINGDIQFDDEYFRGDDVAREINSIFKNNPYGPYPVGTLGRGLTSTGVGEPWAGLPRPVETPLPTQKVAHRLSQMSQPWTHAPGLPPVDKQNIHTLLDSLERRAEAYGQLTGNTVEQQEARLNRLRGTQVEDRLILPDDLSAAGIESLAGLTMEDVRAQASPLRPKPSQSRTPSHFISEPVREGVADYVLVEKAKLYKGQPRDVIARALLVSAMRSFIAHEVGHGLGLTHNFAGSFDAMNYLPQYWQLRNDGNLGPRWRDPLTEAELSGGIFNHAYTSVMDYFRNGEERGSGIGRYDAAVIKYAYGGLVEVFNDPIAKNNVDLAAQLQLWHSSKFANGIFYKNGQVRGIHYTEYPSLFGDLNNREDVPKEMLVNLPGTSIPMAMLDGRPVVPYRQCSDYDTAYATCARDDRGADVYELALDYIQRYYAFYFNTHFRRDRIRMGSPSLSNYTNFFAKLTITQMLNGMAADTPSQLATDDGFAANTLAVSEGFEFLSDMLTIPPAGHFAPAPQLVGPTTYQKVSASTPGAFEVALGDGRFDSTRYESASSGRGYTTRVLWWGSSFDKRTAIDALTMGFNAITNPEDLPNPRATIVSYYSLYPSQTKTLLGAILSDDSATLGPYVDGAQTGLVRRRWVSDPAQVWPPPGATPLDPSISSSTRRHLQAVSFAGLTSGSSNDFLDVGRITVDGAADDFTTTLPVVRFSDPFSGKTFRALSKVENAQEVGVGARMLLRAEALKAVYESPTSTASEKARAEASLRSYLQEIEEFRALAMAFGQTQVQP